MEKATAAPIRRIVATIAPLAMRSNTVVMKTSLAQKRGVVVVKSSQATNISRLPVEMVTMAT